MFWEVQNLLRFRYIPYEQEKLMKRIEKAKSKNKWMNNKY